MKKIIVPLSLAALVSGVFPGRSFGQSQGARQASPKKAADTLIIPPSQRLKNWSDTSTAQTLNDVVVVAYGTQKRTAVTGAVIQVSDSQFAKRPLTNVLDALVAVGPGFQSTMSGGQPGSQSNIRLRGFGSISAGSGPLVVVDGVVYDGDIGSINPADVANITPLLDASAAAMYGSRASNGVILITTKKGSRNKTNVQFKMNQGINVRMLPEYDRVSAYEYYPLMWEFLRNGLIYNNGGMLANQHATSLIKSRLGYNPFNVPDNEIVDDNGKLNPNARLLYADDLDWEKAGTRNGFRQDYNVSFSGGTDNADYYASVGYVSDKGYTPSSDFKRLNGRVSANARLNSFIKAGVNVYGSSTKTNQTPTGGVVTNPFYFSRSVAPIYPVHSHEADGSYTLDEKGQPVYDNGIHSYGIRKFASGYNALAEGLLNINYYAGNSVGARTNVDVSLAKGLKLTSNMGIDQEGTESYNYLNPTIGDGAPSGALYRGNNSVKSYTLNQLLNYGNGWGAHKIEALLGHESYGRDYVSSSSAVRGQISSNNKLELSNYTTISEAPTSSTIEKRIESYFSRINYDYRGAYFVTASVRRDGNSNFAAHRRWENFWSIGGAWLISKEAFFKSKHINELKLKLSYGKSGNDNVGSYAYQGGYITNNNAGEPGYIQALIANKDLTWESGSNLNAGVEFLMFNGRLSGYVQYYDKVSSGLVFAVPQPVSGGGTPGGVFNIWQNIGSLYNRGLELSLTGDIIQRKTFNWEMTVNASTLKNKITKMPETNKEIISGTKKLSEGHSIYDYWLVGYKGVDPANGDALYELKPELQYEENFPYDEPDKTIMGEKYTTSFARAKYDYQGSAIPELYGSIRNDLRYKNFNLGVILTYQIGGLAYDGIYAGLMSPGYGQSLSKDILKRWQHTGDQANTPRLDEIRTNDLNAPSSRWLISATSLTINTVNLGYTFEPAMLKQFRISGLQTFLSVENACLFSARKGMNALQSFNGTTGEVYVPRRVYSLGVIANL